MKQNNIEIGEESRRHRIKFLVPNDEDIDFLGRKREKQVEIPSFLCKKMTIQRQDNSLIKITKKFMEYIKRLGTGNINLSIAAEKIDAKKRRIYDITNVLEGKIKYNNKLIFII